MPLPASLPRCTPTPTPGPTIVLFLLVLAALATGCSGKRAAARSEFWLEAPGDPIVEVDPPELLAADHTMVTLQGVLVDHRVAFETVADYSLELLSDDGATTVLHYAIGAGRRVPVERGEMVWLTLWQKRVPPMRAVRALKVEVWRPGDFLAARRLLAIVQASDLIREDAIPSELGRIVPGSEISYQTAERIGGACGRSLVHRHFEQTLLSGGGPSDGQQRRVLAPGARLTIDQARDRYDLLLIDNREVTSGDCPDDLNSYWAWSAIYIPPPAGTKEEVGVQPEESDGPTNAIAAPADPSSTSAVAPSPQAEKHKKSLRTK